MARILLIEDEEGVRGTVRLILESDGHGVREAGDGGQGVALFEEHTFDLVITDLYMPGKEGIETIQDIRALSPAVPILAISGGGWRQGDALVDARLLGAAATLTKPFSAGDLRRAVNELLVESETPAPVSD